MHMFRKRQVAIQNQNPPKNDKEVSKTGQAVVSKFQNDPSIIDKCQ